TWQKVATQAGFVSRLTLTLTLKAPGGGDAYCGVAVVWNFDAANLSRQAVLYWGGGPIAWKQLPAPPGLDPNDVEYLPIGVTPSCTVIAQVNPFSNPSGGIFAIHPGDATPTWTHYANGNSESWQVVRAQSCILWAFDAPMPSQAGIDMGLLK